MSVHLRLLTELDSRHAITSAIPAASQTLDHVELASLGGARVLMIVATRDQMVRNRVVVLGIMPTQDALEFDPELPERRI